MTDRPIEKNILSEESTDIESELDRAELDETGNYFKEFRINNQKFLLTYKSHLDKIKVEEMLKKHPHLPEKFKCYIAHENGKNDPVTPYEHTHIVVNFGKAISKTNPRCFDFDGYHPNISLIKTTKQWLKACKYVCKEDKSVVLAEEDQFVEKKDGFNVEKVWACDTLEEALKLCHSPSDAPGIIAIFSHKPKERLRITLEEKDFRRFQRQICAMIWKDPDDRKVTWIYDKVGNTGKTQLVKFLMRKHPEKIVAFNAIGKIADFNNNIKTHIEKNNWKGDTIFFNLSRSYAERDNIYEAAEIVKDGFGTATKYTGGMWELNTCHLIIMANFFPNLESLSKDRWDIYEISKDFSLDRSLW